MKVTDNKRKRILDNCTKARTLYKDGLSCAEIGRVIGKTRQYVWMCVKGNGLKTGIKTIREFDLPDIT